MYINVKDIFVIKIDIDNTFIYKKNNLNKTLLKLNDNVGKYYIPTVLYIEKNNDIIFDTSDVSIKSFTFRHG